MGPFKILQLGTLISFNSEEKLKDDRFLTMDSGQKCIIIKGTTIKLYGSHIHP